MVGQSPSARINLPLPPFDTTCSQPLKSNICILPNIDFASTTHSCGCIFPKCLWSTCHCGTLVCHAQGAALLKREVFLYMKLYGCINIYVQVSRYGTSIMLSIITPHK